MSAKIPGTLLLLAAGLVLLAALATAVALLRALLVSSTLAAIESAFGSFVLLIILLLCTRGLYKAGMRRFRASAEQPSTEEKTVQKSSQR